MLDFAETGFVLFMIGGLLVFLSFYVVRVCLLRLLLVLFRVSCVDVWF